MGVFFGEIEDFIPQARPPESRRVASRKLEIWNTLEGWAGASTFTFGHLFLTPIFNQSTITTTGISLRTSGGTTWAVAGASYGSSFSIGAGVYSNHPTDNLPSKLLASGANTNILGAGISGGTLTTNTELTLTVATSLSRGWYWLGFVCYGLGTSGGTATSFEISEVGSADKLSQLSLAYLIGLSPSSARGLVTSATAALPADLDSRDVQVNTGTPNTTSLRTRSGPPGMRLEYTQ